MADFGPGPGGPRRGPGSDDESPSGTWMVHGAMGAMLVATLGLNLRLEVGLLEAVLAAFLVFGLPFLSVAQLSVLDPEGLDRPGVYAGSAVTLVILTMAALVIGALGPGLEPMGLGLGDPVALAWATLRLGVATVVLMTVFHLVATVGKIPESPVLLALLPRTAHERRLFAGLALLAGFGEEVVFRGFLLAVLTPALGDPWTALVASSLAFGVLHVYQGSYGILRTASLGGLLGVSVVMEQSLWPAVIVHVLVDLVGGLVTGPRMLRSRNS